MDRDDRFAGPSESTRSELTLSKQIPGYQREDLAAFEGRQEFPCSFVIMHQLHTLENLGDGDRREAEVAKDPDVLLSHRLHFRMTPIDDERQDIRVEDRLPHSSKP